MNTKTYDYLRQLFADYYEHANVDTVPTPAMREFGLIPWNRGERTIMNRHKSITEYGTVNNMLREEAPRHAYHSSAEYLKPGAQTTAQKEEQRVDLVFDIDGDHFEGHSSMSYVEMLERSKQELIRLCDMLQSDFGFSVDDMDIVFSGGRGYHVHVRDTDAQQLDSEARSEIISYITGSGNAESMSFTAVDSNTGEILEIISPDGGWGKYIHQYLDMMDYTKDELEKIEGIGSVGAEWLVDNRESVRNGQVNSKYAKKLIANVYENAKETFTVDVDEPVTTDIHRLIRIPKSVHGGTGMCVQPIPFDDIESFHPTEDAVMPILSDTIPVTITHPGIYEFGGEKYDLEARDESLPGGIAVYLMASGGAEYNGDHIFM